MRDFSDDLAALGHRVGEAETYLRVALARERVVELEVEASRPDLWDDQDEARKVTAELSTLQSDLTTFDALTAALSDLATLAEMAREEDDDSLEPEILEGMAELGRRLSELELRALFAGEHDERDAICEVHAGEGGTDAQDWAEMLVRQRQEVQGLPRPTLLGREGLHRGAGRPAGPGGRRGRLPAGRGGPYPADRPRAGGIPARSVG